MKEQATGGVGQWLMEKCQKSGLSLRQAASKIGLSHATIADIIKGGRPSPESLKRLAQAFGGNGDQERLAVEDRLLTLAGYRTPRPEGEEPDEFLAHLLDKLSEFSKPKLEMVGHFIDFISTLEGK